MNGNERTSNSPMMPALSGDDAQQVLQNERELARAHLLMDLAIIDQLLHSGYTLLQPDGLVEDKQAVLASYRQGSREWHSATASNMEVVVYGNLALVCGLWSAAGRNGAEAFDYTARFLSMWRKDDGRWRNIAYQSRVIPGGSI